MTSLFGIEHGIHLDNKVHVLYGNVDPFLNPDQDVVNAPIGSSYSNIVNGSQYKRVAILGKQSDWVELAGKEIAIIVNGISSTGVMIDQVPAKLADSFAWEVTAFNEASPSDKLSVLIHMSHNGTATTPATNISYSISNRIVHGNSIPGIQIIGTLSGVSPNQMMNLHVSSSVPTTFIALRMIANIAGSDTLVIGGANLDNHILDGTVHLTAWQNALLDGVDQTLTSNEINYVKGVTSSVQTQLNNKQPIDADLTAIAGLTGTSGLLKKTAADTWTLDTVDYLPLIGGTLTGTLNFGERYSEKVNDRGSISGTQTIDLILGTYVTATITSATTFTFTNPSISGTACGFVLELINGGTGVITWPTSVKWPGGTAPTLTANGVDLLLFMTRDAGTTWRAVQGQKDSK